VAGDIHRRPALAEKFMHTGKQSLQPFQAVSAIEIRPVCSVLPHFDGANQPLALTAQMLLNPVAQVLDQKETVGDLSGLACADSGAFGVEPVAIAADDFHPGCWLSHVASEAEERSGSTLATVLVSRSTRMVPHAAPLRQAHSSTPTTRSFRPRRFLRPTLEMPENRIAAHHDAKLGEQPARGFASSEKSIRLSRRP
jgi:hypothetical protein